MKKYMNQLQSNVLFQNIQWADIESVLKCLSARIITYNKKDIILFQGDKVSDVGIILSGSAKVIREDVDGRTNILTHLERNEVFAESFACVDLYESPVTIQALENCEVMLINCRHIIKSCHKGCVFHTVLIKNILSLIAYKNILLNEKIEILSKRTTREKLYTYFNFQMLKSRSKKFTIPFDREGLANYLAVDRSALSRELCNMRDQGLITFKKNDFEVLG